MTPPVFVLPDLSSAATGTVIDLTGSEGRHAAAVLRIAVGEQVAVVDGHGRRIVGPVLEVAGREMVRLRVDEVSDEPEPRPRVTVVQALPKGERGELAVELLTEIGVDVIVPWSARNCVAQWRGDRADRGYRRWSDAAYAAAKQARRARFPSVAPLATTPDVIGRIEAASSALVLHESATRSIGGVDADAADVLLIVGPEGGIDPQELAAFEQAGAQTVVLGPTVLRSSSAGMAAVAALLAHTSRWGGRMTP